MSEELIQKRTKALENSVKYMRAFLDLQPSPICIIDKKNSEIIDGSQKFLQNFGFISPDELRDYFKNPRVLIDNISAPYPEILSSNDWIQDLVVNADKTFRVEIEIDSEIKTYEVAARNMLYSSGLSDEDYEKYNYVVVILNDVTDLMKELHKNREQEAKLIQNSKMAQMGEMIGAIAHQWKQPLNILSLYTFEIIDHVNDFDGLQSIADGMSEQIDYMANTIDDFRRFFLPSKETAIFNVQDALKSVEKLIRKHLKNNSTHLEIAGENCFSLGYENEFKQVIINIVNNSKDAIKEKGVEDGLVTVTTEINEDFVDVIINDNGGGITPELLPDKIFTPYITTKGDKGTGIGLSMVKTIVEQKLKGEISVENIADGASFTIKIPKADSVNE